MAELVNLPPHSADPYVGQSAFAHKGGLHTSALGKAGGATYEHIDPELVGNGTRVLVSDLGGRAGMVDEGQGARRRPRRPRRRRCSRRTSSSSSPRASCSRRPTPASSCSCAGPPAGSSRSSRVEGYRATTYHRAGGGGRGRPSTPRPRVKLWVGDERLIAVGEGNGPVNALDQALRSVLRGALPAARPHPPHRLPGPHPRRRGRHRRRGPGALDSTDGDRAWTTIGVSHQHHRGLLAGPHRRPGVGAAPRRPVRFGGVAAPEFVPVDRTKLLRTYESPPRRPDPWLADRPGELRRRPAPRRPARLPGPRPGLRAPAGPPVPRASSPSPAGEHERDALAGASPSPSSGPRCSAGRRSSTTSPSPSPSGASSATPPPELVRAAQARCSRRWRTRTTTASCAASSTWSPRTTLRMTPQQVAEAHRADWRSLLAELPRPH